MFGYFLTWYLLGGEARYLQRVKSEPALSDQIITFQ